MLNPSPSKVSRLHYRRTKELLNLRTVALNVTEKNRFSTTVHVCLQIEQSGTSTTTEQQDERECAPLKPPAED